MQIKIPFFGGGHYYDNTGKLRQYRLWWPILIAQYIDTFFRVLRGKEGLGIQSTMTVVHRSGNSHTPKDQKVSLVMIDPDTPGRMIWGTDMTPANARATANALFHLAESIEPFFTTPENRAKMADILRENENANFEVDEEKKELTKTDQEETYSKW